MEPDSSVEASGMNKQQPKPPWLVKWFASKFMADELLEEFFGDLEEIYSDRESTKGAAYAKMMYCVDAVHLLIGFSTIGAFRNRTNPSPMYRHYFLVAFRSLGRTKLYSIISVLSLAVGIAVCLLISQYLYFELSYDTNFKNFENTFRLTIDKDNAGGQRYPYPYESGYAVGITAKAEIPEIDQFVRLHKYSGGSVVTNPQDGKPFTEDALDILFVDGNFFQVFDFPLSKGDRESVFRDKYSIVITEQMARKYFGSGDAWGKVLTLDGGVSPGSYVVTGIVADLPLSSHLQFRFLLPIENYIEFGWGGAATKNDDGWSSLDCATYFTLHESANIATVTEKLDQMIARHVEDKNGDNGIIQRASLQPIQDIHLRSDPTVDPGLVKNTGNMLVVTFFSIIAVFILIVAWVNYINLSTARSIQRSKEVGVRKSIGALRGQLIGQFMMESLVINLIAALLSVGLATLTLPLLTKIIGVDFEFNMPRQLIFWLCLALLVFCGAVLSGLLPALILSSFKPVNMLGASKNLSRSGNFSFRKGLITFQFVVSVLLISGTYLVYKQIRFMKSQELGMNLEAVLVLKGPEVNLDRSVIESTLLTFKEKVADHHSIISVAASSSVPGKGYNTGLNIRRVGAPASSEKFGRVIFAGPDIEKTYDLKFVAGNPPTQQVLKAAIVPVVINEEAVRAFGLGTPENAIGEQLYYKNDTFDIAGVVRDFHWHSLADTQAPYLFEYYADCSTFFSIKMNFADLQETLRHIEETYSTFFPGNPFDFFFIKDAFNQQYKPDVQFGNLVLVFTILAIFIACIGLFALISYSATLKIKEIGIRKVMGASVSSLMLFLSRDYISPLVLASILAAPVIYYGGTVWLANYAYRTDITIELFLIPGLLLVVISCLTVCYRTFVAARANPVDSLRAE